MAPLRGWVDSDRRTTTASRLGTNDMTANLSTWEGEIEVTLTRDGEFTVSVGEKYGRGEIIARGNVGDDPIFGRHVVSLDGRVYTQQTEGFSTRFRPVRMTRKVQRQARTHAGGRL